MRKKGFTLIELLVVIAIIAMLLAILMPALGRVKRLAQRLVCATNLRGLGQACQVYGSDFDDEFPITGKGNVSNSASGAHTWTIVDRGGIKTAVTKAWDNESNGDTKDWTIGGTVTVGASLYQLVREADVGTKSFVCKSGDEKPYDGSNPGDPTDNDEPWDLVQLWDFGELGPPGSVIKGETPRNGPLNHVSYAYQNPYQASTLPGRPAYPATSTAPSTDVIMADKNPWHDRKLIDGTAANPGPDSDNWPTMVGFIEWDETIPSVKYSTSWDSWMLTIGNSHPHGREGQNLLFGDGHTNFLRRPDISTRNDNIYTRLGAVNGEEENNFRQGQRTRFIADSWARSDDDTLLVNDGECTQP